MAPIDDRDFFKVELDTFSPNQCSPNFPDESTRGIIISAPKRAPFEYGKSVGERQREKNGLKQDLAS